MKRLIVVPTPRECDFFLQSFTAFGFQRRREIRHLTGALAVAWEGGGGARACHFSGVPFIEIRGISDQADSQAASHFRMNLHTAMRNVATLITAWITRIERS
jgi:adenosylhomocysteine nucleosidase